MNGCRPLARNENPIAAPASSSHLVDAASSARVVQYAAAAISSTISESGLLNRNISTATGVSASNAPARMPAQWPNQRLTVACTSHTVSTPSIACGTSIDQALKPNSRPEISIGQSAAGGLSTVMKLDESNEPKNSAFQLLRAGLDGGGVEVVRVAGRAQPPDVEQRGAAEQGQQRGAVSAIRSRPLVGRRFAEGRGGAEVESGRGHDGDSFERKTHTRSRTKRSTVASRLAVIRTASSATRGGRLDTWRQQPERATGQAQPEPEHDEPLQLVAGRSVAAADAEGEPPVGGRVGDRGHEQRDEVGRLRAEERAGEHEQQQVGQRADHADGGEAHRLAGEQSVPPGPDRGPVGPRARRRAGNRCAAGHRGGSAERSSVHAENDRAGRVSPASPQRQAFLKAGWEPAELAGV